MIHTTIAKGNFFLLLFILATHLSSAQNALPVKPGAERMEVYLPWLMGKKVGVFANQTSVVRNSRGLIDSTSSYTHLVDTLLKSGINVVKIFSPEHGFRGLADAGEKVASTKDKITGLPIISLYGDHKKPTKQDLADMDVLIFDIQDVGVRFYTYISSLQYIMEATLVNDKPLLILDRPNPNGFYVDGPVLEEGYQSFLGMQKIPVVYGMTIGEYALMIAGEKWLADPLANKKNSYNITLQPTKDTPFHVQIIKCKNYNHSTYYKLPVRPSPNLPDMQSVLLYPSLCFFEGTDISLGRGTSKPFQMYGSPQLPDTLAYSFTPISTEGAKEPPLKNKKCYGYDLSQTAIDITKKEYQQFNLSYLLNAYKLFPAKDYFFLRPAKSNPENRDYAFNKLTGNYTLMWQLMNFKTEAQIRQSWQKGIRDFMKVRAKYLLYD